MHKPNAVSVTDITYIKIYKGWLYLAVVMDLLSRKIIGWSMKYTLAKETVLGAPLMAVWRRSPKEEIIIHSEQGAQFRSDEWNRFFSEHNLVTSINRRGHFYDNAAMK